MIFGRFALLALLAGCGESFSNAPAFVSVPAPRVESFAATSSSSINGDLEWWARLDVETHLPAQMLFPNASGGVSALVMTPETNGHEAPGPRAALVEVNSAGHPFAMQPVIEGKRVVPAAVALGERGEIVIAGSFGDEVGIEQASVGGVEVAGHRAMFLVALDAHGVVWRSMFEHALVYSIARGANGVVVVTGQIETPIDFGGGNIGGNFHNVFIAAFDRRGRHLFSHAFATDDFETGPTRVAILGDGTIDLIGHLRTNTSVDFGDGLREGGEHGASYVARFDDRGNCLKSSLIPALRMTDAAVGPSGDVVLGGLEHGGKPDEGSRLIVRLDQDENEMWRRSFGLEIWSRFYGADRHVPDAVPVALDPQGNVLTAFAPWKDNALWSDIMLFDKSGTLIFERPIEGTFTISTIAFSSTGDAFLSGWNVDGPISPDGPISYGWDRLAPDPKHAIFVMKLGH